MSRRPVLTVAALVTAAGALTLLPGGSPTASAAGLVAYGSCAELLADVRTQLRASVTGPGPLERVFASTDDAGAESDAAASAPAAAAVGRGATGTNLQEQDVDEPDSAKLADGNLLVLSGNRLSVVTATASPRLLGSLPLGGQGWASELLVVGDRAVVVQSGWTAVPGAPGLPEPQREIASDIAVAGSPTTRLVLVDVSDPTAPRLLEDATWSGSYLSSRLTDGTVRLVTSSRPELHPVDLGRATQGRVEELLRAAAERVPLEQVVPQLVRRDDAGRVVSEAPAVACERVAHPVAPAGPSTLLVTTLRPELGLGPVDATAVVADGELVYASSDRLYVGTSRWTAGRLGLSRGTVDTEVHAFDTTAVERTRYLASGSVPGHAPGRWALSEHDGALRVATTRDAGTEDSSSSLFVLTEQGDALREVGSVHGLGLTEEIKSVRYFGETAVVVTFRQTDPLYVLDLRDPTAPRVTGELKITGFSTYLHPLGDGLLLGLGLDATETGQVTGMQLSTFDVGDPAQPRLVDRMPLGQGWSSALDDSRAFGYDPQRRLVTLPYQGSTPTGLGTSAALGLRVAADGQITLAGRLDTGPHGVDRVMARDEVLLAVGQGVVVAATTSDLTRTGSVVLPG